MEYFLVRMCGENADQRATELIARAVHWIRGRTGPIRAVRVADGDDDRFSAAPVSGHAPGAPPAAPEAVRGIDNELIAKDGDAWEPSCAR